jgi:hypothetical protein
MPVPVYKKVLKLKNGGQFIIGVDGVLSIEKDGDWVDVTLGNGNETSWPREDVEYLQRTPQVVT